MVFTFPIYLREFVCSLYHVLCLFLLDIECTFVQIRMLVVSAHQYWIIQYRIQSFLSEFFVEYEKILVASNRIGFQCFFPQKCLQIVTRPPYFPRGIIPKKDVNSSW